MAKKNRIIIAALAAIGVGALGFYALLKVASGYISKQGHGILYVNGSVNAVNNSISQPLSFRVTGQTPGALIQIYFNTNPSPVGGAFVGASGTADSSGSVTLTYTLTPATPIGFVFYASGYDTAIGSVSGYSNWVQITVTA